MIQNRSFRCGRPLKSQKNVKRKHYFQKFDAPVSHLRLWRLLRHNFQTFFSSVFFYKNMDDLIPSPKIDENRCTIVQNRWKSIKNVVLSCFFLKNRWKSLYCRSKSMAFDTFSIKNNHSVAEVPQKVEKTSSENTTFANSEHPYRTCGLSAGSFDSIVVATCWY